MNSITKIFALLLAVTLSLIAHSAPEPEPMRAPTVITETLKASPLFDILTYPARIVPKINATLLSEVDGIVLRVFAPLGASVTRNQKVLTIQHTDPVYEYAPVTVTAPVTGIVGQVEVSEGAHVNKGQKLATITDPGKILFQVEVAGFDLPAILSGLHGELKIPGQDKLVTIKVVGVSPFVDPGTGTATAELSLVEKNPKFLLPPGLVGRVSFKVRDHLGLQIPESAIVYKGRETLVRIVENKKSRMVTVRVGQSRRGVVEILDGLKDGNTVVVRASTYIANGEEVTVQEMGTAED